MKKVDLDYVFMGGAIIGFAATIIYSINTNKKMNKVADNLDVALEDLIDDKLTELPYEMVERSVQRSIDSRYHKLMCKACDDAITRVRNDMDKKLQQAVDKEFDRQKDSVAKELKYKIGNLDISQVKKEVIKEAKTEAAEKFKIDLDMVTSKYNDQLDQISTIYTSIASKMKGEV